MYFDAHSDIWCDVTTRRLNGETNVFDRCHLERMRKGGVEGSIFVIWVDPPYDVDYVKRTEQIMAAAKAEIAECQSFRIVHTYDEMMQANADGKIYIFIGIEGMATMGKDLSWIDRYYDFGCRHGILTWNEANDLGAGALSGKDRLFLLLHGGCGRARGKKRGNCGNCRDVCGKRDGTSGAVFPDIHRLDAGGVGMESAFVHGFVADSRALDHIHDSQTLIMRRSCEKMGQILSVCTR